MRPFSRPFNDGGNILFRFGDSGIYQWTLNLDDEENSPIISVVSGCIHRSSGDLFVEANSDTMDELVEMFYNILHIKPKGQ